MADIDKGLPNTRTQIKVPGEEVEVKEEIKEQQPIEVTPEDDGGATINFEPGAVNIPGTESHFDNCLLYTSPSPRDRQKSRMPSSA